MVGQGGLEPPRYCYRQDLNLVRLPISPLTEKRNWQLWQHMLRRLNQFRIVLLKFLMNKLHAAMDIKKDASLGVFSVFESVAIFSCLPFLAQSTPCRYLGVTGAEVVMATRN